MFDGNQWNMQTLSIVQSLVKTNEFLMETNGFLMKTIGFLMKTNESQMKSSECQMSIRFVNLCVFTNSA